MALLSTLDPFRSTKNPLTLTSLIKGHVPLLISEKIPAYPLLLKPTRLLDLIKKIQPTRLLEAYLFIRSLPAY